MDQELLDLMDRTKGSGRVLLQIQDARRGTIALGASAGLEHGYTLKPRDQIYGKGTGRDTLDPEDEIFTPLLMAIESELSRAGVLHSSISPLQHPGVRTVLSLDHKKETLVRSIKTLAALGIVALSTLAARAEDWPKWLGPRGDGITRETGLIEKWPEGGPKQVWAVPNIGIGYSSPVAVDGKLYLFALNDGAKQDVLYCLDAATGKEIWKQAYDNGYAADFKGTRATPLIDGQFIYTYGGNGQLTCRQLADGKQVWQTNVMKETGGSNLQWGLASAPLLYDGKLHVQAGKNAPILVAVDAKSGKIVWQSDKGLGGYAHPIIAEVEGKKQMIAFGGDAVWGFDADSGKTLWKETWQTKYDVNAMTPLYRDGHLFISSNYDRGCMMLKLSAGGAQKLWENKNMKSHFQPMIFDNGVFYGNSQGALTCMAWPTGDIKWQAKEPAMRLGNGGSLNRFGDKLITMSERAKLTLLKATPGGFEVISQVDRLFDGNQIWSTPLIYNGKLYCKGTSELVCLDISGK